MKGPNVYPELDQTDLELMEEQYQQEMRRLMEEPEYFYEEDGITTDILPF